MLSVTYKPFMQSVIMFSVVMLTVVAPGKKVMLKFLEEKLIFASKT